MIQQIDNARVIEGTANTPSWAEVQGLPSRTIDFSLPSSPFRDRYLVSTPWIAGKVTMTPNKDLRAVLADQREISAAPLVRRLHEDVSKRNVKVQALQRWTGRVERVLLDRFVAIIRDVTTPENPAEEVELELQEISRPDRSLLAPGAIFYWAIVYRDTKDGQRERITTLRFARQPKLSEKDLEDIYKEGDRIAELLQSA